MKRYNCYILFEGSAGSDEGTPVRVFLNKSILRGYVSKKYPDARGVNRETPSELYWETSDGWLRCRSAIDQVPLVLKS